MGSCVDLTGNRFGLLQILSRTNNTAQDKARWQCLCDCGRTSVVTTGSLKSGQTKSCGCLQRTSAKRSGPSRRRIDYDSVVCHICDMSLTHLFLNGDGSLKKGLCESRLSHLTCENCHGNISRRNGRIPSELNSSLPVSELQMDVIIGSILGDGSFECSPVSGNPNWSLAVKHGLKQKAYCLWKADLLGDLISTVDEPFERIRFRTKKHAVITTIAKKMVANGKKSVNEEFVRHMGPLGYAIWYLDDGNLLPNRIGKNGKARKPEIRFSSCSFNERENLLLRRIIEDKIGVKTTRCSWLSRSTFGKKLDEPRRLFGIRLYGENAEKFLEFIRPFVDWRKSGMAYKMNTTVRGPLDNKHTRRKSIRSDPYE